MTDTISPYPLVAVFAHGPDFKSTYERPIIGWDEDDSPYILDGRVRVNAHVFAARNEVRFIEVDRYTGHIVSTFAAAPGTMGFDWAMDDDAEDGHELDRVPVIGWATDNWGNTWPVTLNCRETGFDRTVFAVEFPAGAIYYTKELSSEDEQRFRKHLKKVHMISN